LPDSCDPSVSLIRKIILAPRIDYMPGAEARKRPQFKHKKAGLSGKEAARDVPSWAHGERPLTTESGTEFAQRLLDAKYGQGTYPKGPGSEFNKIKKWGDRAFE
jgi:hypothetical protein